MLPAAETILRQIIPFKQLKHLQYRHPLTVGRHLPDLMPSVVDRNRIHPLRPVAAHILHRQIPTQLLNVIGYDAGDRSAERRGGKGGRYGKMTAEWPGRGEEAS